MTTGKSIRRAVQSEKINEYLMKDDLKMDESEIQ